MVRLLRSGLAKTWWIQCLTRLSVDDGEESPSPAPATKQAAPAKTQAAPAQQRSVPGAAPRGGAANRGRGSQPTRGARSQNTESRNTGAVSGDVAAEGFETAGGFDGERVGECCLKLHKVEI